MYHHGYSSRSRFWLRRGRRGWCRSAIPAGMLRIACWIYRPEPEKGGQTRLLTRLLHAGPLIRISDLTAHGQASRRAARPGARRPAAEPRAASPALHLRTARNVIHAGWCCVSRAARAVQAARVPTLAQQISSGVGVGETLSSCKGTRQASQRSVSQYDGGTCRRAPQANTRCVTAQTPRPGIRYGSRSRSETGEPLVGGHCMM